MMSRVIGEASLFSGDLFDDAASSPVFLGRRGSSSMVWIFHPKEILKKYYCGSATTSQCNFERMVVLVKRWFLFI